MTTALTLNTISAVSIDSFELEKDSLLRSRFYMNPMSFKKDEVGFSYNLISADPTLEFYSTSVPLDTPKWDHLDQLLQKTTQNFIFIDESEKIQQTNKQEETRFSDKVINLQEELGNDIFNQLKDDQLRLLVNTAGVFDFGPIDIKKVYKYIEEY